MTDIAPRRGDTLGPRLALAFLAVALAAIALLAGLAAAYTAADVSRLADRQRTELANAISVAAGAAWDRRDSWDSADLAPVLDLAQQAGASVEIRDTAGHVVALSPGFGAAEPGAAEPDQRGAGVRAPGHHERAFARSRGDGEPG